MAPTCPVWVTFLHLSQAETQPSLSLPTGILELVLPASPTPIFLLGPCLILASVNSLILLPPTWCWDTETFQMWGMAITTLYGIILLLFNSQIQLLNYLWSFVFTLPFGGFQGMLVMVIVPVWASNDLHCFSYCAFLNASFLHLTCATAWDMPCFMGLTLRFPHA